MPAFTPDDLDWSDAWVEGVDGGRWRSTTAFGASAGARESGCSLLEVEPESQLPRHTDSAEETIVVMEGVAGVTVGDAPEFRLTAGGVGLVPREVPHHVRNLGDGPLRFAAVYAAPEVVTTYEQPVQPAGERERQSAS
jgi:quercetin dioxygenase-like cupin family protein